jgi:hypothetical protein
MALAKIRPRPCLAIAFGLAALTSGAQDQTQKDSVAHARAEVARIFYAKVNNPDSAIARLYEEISTTPMGADVADFALNSGIGMVYEPAIIFSGRNGGYDFTRGIIQAFPEPSNNLEHILATHEIRHGWGDKKLDFFKGALETLIRPSDQWALLRFNEADAYAFSIYCFADYLVRKGEKKVPAEMIELSYMPLLEKTFARLSEGRPMGAKEYRKEIFEPCLAILSGYDDRHLAYIRERNEDLAKIFNAPASAAQMQQIDSLYHLMQRTPDDKQIEKLLRHFGGKSMDPNEPTSLGTFAVSRKKLLGDYPYRSIAKADITPALKKEDMIFEEHRARILQLGTKLHR